MSTGVRSTMNLLHGLAPRDDSGNTRVVVEVPAGDRLKLKYDGDRGYFVASRLLASGLRFPHDFGFVPQTLAGDGDAIDAFVYAEVGSYPGVVVPGRVIGAMKVEQQRGAGPAKRNDRLVIVPSFDHARAQLADVSQLEARVRQEFEQFLHMSLVLTGKKIRFLGWANANEARQLLSDAAVRYAAEQRASGPRPPS